MIGLPCVRILCNDWLVLCQNTVQWLVGHVEMLCNDWLALCQNTVQWLVGPVSEYCAMSGWPMLKYCAMTVWPMLKYCAMTGWPMLKYCAMTSWPCVRILCNDWLAHVEILCNDLLAHVEILCNDWLVLLWLVGPVSEYCAMTGWPCDRILCNDWLVLCYDWLGLCQNIVQWLVGPCWQTVQWLVGLVLWLVSSVSEYCAITGWPCVRLLFMDDTASLAHNLSHWGSTSNCPYRSVSEVHPTWYWNTKQPKKNTTVLVNELESHNLSNTVLWVDS